MASAAVATVLALGLGSVAAQDDAEAMDDTDAMEHMDAGISIRAPWTRESMMRDLAGAAYMVIHNSTDDADTLIGASSPAAAVVEIHETSMGDDGAMAMQMVGEIPLAPHADTVLEPGGYHIMLIDLVEPLLEGAEIELSLEFATAEPQTISVPVTGPMGPEDMGMGDTDHGDMGETGDMDMSDDGMEEDEG
jgi:copper(I)-binding protein